MDGRHCKPLLPALEPLHRQLPDPPAKKQQKKRRHLTKVACNPCRSRKGACDGLRPSCSACQHRGEQCSYVTKDASETSAMALKRENEMLKARFSLLEQLLKYIRELPDSSAKSVLNKIEANADRDAALAIASGTTLERRVSEQQTVRGALTDMPSGFEFELMVTHPVAYSSFDLSDRNLFSSDPLLGWMNISQAGYIPDSTDVASNLLSSMQGSSSAFSSQTTWQQVGLGVDMEIMPRNPSGYVEPLPPVIYHDPRLSGLKIAFWTTVPVTDHHAATAISQYLEKDHPIYGVVDAQLFIKSLIGCKFDYCSSFLVNALLALATRIHPADSPELVNKSEHFENEAKRLWLIEKSFDTLTTIAGLVYLALSLSTGIRDQAGASYLSHAVDMAGRLKLFGVSDRLSPKQFSYLAVEEQKATAQAAWGTFNALSTYSFFYVLEITEFPPVIPIPGSSSSASIECAPSPADAGQIFAAFCSFWNTASQVLIILRKVTSPLPISIAFALSKYQEVLAVTDGLPNCMATGAYTPNSVLFFQMLLHRFILDLFRPFVLSESHCAFKGSKAYTKSPEAIYAASVKQLKRLVLLHAKASTSNGPCVWGNAALIYVANAVLKDRTDLEWRFYFFLCIQAYQNLLPFLPVADWIIKSLLTMAVDAGAMSASEVNSISKAIRTNHGRPHQTPQGLLRGFTVDFNHASTDPNAASVNTLAQRFDQISFFEESTTGIF